MAKFYGSGGSYLLRKDVGYYLLSGALAVLPFLLMWAILKTISGAYALAGALITSLILIKLADPFIYFFKRKSGKFYRGWGGEKDIKRELENLPNDYHVFQNVILNPKKNNLDFVVAGENGIFTVEVKSHKGEMGFNGQELTVNGLQFKGGGVLRQAWGQANALKKFLNVNVTPVVVFSDPTARLHFGTHPINGVYIVGKKWLNDLIRSVQGFPASVSLEKTIQALKSRV